MCVVPNVSVGHFSSNEENLSNPTAHQLICNSVDNGKTKNYNLEKPIGYRPMYT
jgi:hypothetical protein